MAPFSIPAPHIIPLQLTIGGSKSIDTNIKIQLVCETYLQHEIFYTIDGTKPQPYAGIVQGNKTIKYLSPFCLPPGKIPVKAVAVNANIHSMRSNIVTKCFDVLKDESTESAKRKVSKNLKKKHAILKKNADETLKEQTSSMQLSNKFDSNALSETNHFEEAFIASTDVEIESNNKESDIEDVIETSYSSDNSETHITQDETEDIKPSKNCNGNHIDDKSALAEYLICDEENVVTENTTFNNPNNVEPQFCCLKCDMTLQPCFACKRMNTVSSKFCIECGKQLAQVCAYCKEHNPSVAMFCQFCGKKLDHSANNQLEICLKVDNSIIAKPQLKDIGIQKLSPVLLDKSSQTVKESSVKKNSPKYHAKQLPRQSPGRGYWHQQLDYICNHLKTHAYNNLDFRKIISDPILCDFQSAHINKDENSVTVTLIFSQLVIDKDSISASEGIKVGEST